jgi:hypothetical protein
MDPQLSCPNCKQNIAAQDFFCPNCGKKLKNKPQSTTVLRQIFVYLLSILLPPLGLWPGIRYLKQKDSKSKIIGLIAIILTIITTTITIWWYIGFIRAFNQQINQQLNQQLNGNLNLYR